MHNGQGGPHDTMECGSQWIWAAAANFLSETYFGKAWETM